MTDDPLLSPDHELPKPHDMQLESGKNAPKEPVPPSNSSSDSLPRWLIFLVPIALLLIFTIAIFSMQNQNSEETRRTPEKVVNITSNPTPTPSDWKSYTNEKYSFQISYPSYLIVQEKNDQEINFVWGDRDTKAYRTPQAGYKITINQPERNFEKIYSAPENSEIKEGSSNTNSIFTKTANTIIDGTKAVYFTYLPIGSFSPEDISGVIIFKDNNSIEISQDRESIGQSFDEFISTFKFLQATPSPSGRQSTCTMDAKLCPDGSSVGRTGPRCEFAACPAN